jgi:hypothetical protein
MLISPGLLICVLARVQGVVVVQLDTVVPLAGTTGP